MLSILPCASVTRWLHPARSPFLKFVEQTFFQLTVYFSPVLNKAHQSILQVILTGHGRALQSMLKMIKQALLPLIQVPRENVFCE